MKIWKYSMLFASMIMLLTVSITVSAETEVDATGDVIHWRTTDDGFNWEYDAAKPNIDITEMSCDAAAGTITLSMTIAGTFEDSAFITYSLNYYSGDSGYYISYVNGKVQSMYTTPTGGGDGSTPVVTSGNTLTCTFDGDIDDPSTFTFSAATFQRTVLNDPTAEYWTDVYNDDAGDDDGGSNDDSSSDDEGTGTPGFEVLTLIATIGIAIIVLRKRK